jgi:adenosyl cobinamide kinase/adenosyl cobinamide phosphate guanylyltransferase
LDDEEIEGHSDDLYENTSIYTDAELIGQLAAESYEKAALACYIIGDFEKAVVNAQKAKQLNPEPKYGFKLSKYLARVGKSELAVTELNDAIEKLPELFNGTFNDLDLLNEIKVHKLLKDKNEQKTDKIYELINFLKTTNTKEDAYYIKKLKVALKDNYENKVKLINEVNFVNDTKVKLSAEIEKLLNELKTTNKTKYKNYIYNLEQAFNYNNYQKESLIKFIQICLKKEEKIDNELNVLSQNIANQHKNLLIINDDFKILLESDLFSKTSFLKKWEKGILQQNENLKNEIRQNNLDSKNEISKLNEDLKNQIEILQNQIADLNDNAKQNEKYENNSLVIGIGGMLGGFIITFIYGILFYDWTNSKLDLNIIGMYLTFGSPIIGLVIQRLRYYKKFDKKENKEKRGELYKNIESLKSKFRTFEPIENTSKSYNLIKDIKLSFNISKYTHWISIIMNNENVNFNENDLLRFIINDKIYIINKLIGTNNFEQTIYERDELFEDAALLFVKSQEASTSLMQRRLNLGYNRANRIMEQLELAGIVSSFVNGIGRDVLVTSEEELEELLNKELDF